VITRAELGEPLGLRWSVTVGREVLLRPSTRHLGVALGAELGEELASLLGDMERTPVYWDHHLDRS
jgi:hypothetical protein